VSAALATFKGFKHGGAAARVLEMALHAATLKRARATIAEQLRAGHTVPGFGHPLYPNGDPRGRILLQMAESSGNARSWEPFRHLVRAGAEVLQDAPNLDCGLAAITRTFALPDDAPAVLFATGRTIGWIAHALEEYASGELIRPRARYTGLEVSEYLCRKHGWAQGSIATFDSARAYDLVICYDVLQYLQARPAAAALRNLARLCTGVLHFGALTQEDWELYCDKRRTDRNVHVRPGDWYRRRLARAFINAGSGMFVRRGAPLHLWELDQVEVLRPRR